MLKSKNEEGDVTNVIDAKAKQYQHNKGVQKSDKIPQIYVCATMVWLCWRAYIDSTLNLVHSLQRLN